MKRGDLVKYVPHEGASPEFGIVTTIHPHNSHVAFVRYFRTRANSEATQQEHLAVIDNVEELLKGLEAV